MECPSVIDEINDVLSKHGQSEAVKAMFLLLKAQNPAGSWEHSGNPLCSAIQTTQAMDALLAIGYDGWVYDELSPLRKAGKWLYSNQHLPQGNWGEDPFDTSEVLRILIRLNHEIKSKNIKDSSLENAIQKGVEHLRSICADKENRFVENRGFGWYGPAFWATAAVVFQLMGDLSLARDLVEDIWTFRKEIANTGTPQDGCAYFECPDQYNDSNLRIWNTSHTVIGLTRLTEMVPTKYDLSPFVRWLEYQQNCEQKISDKIKGSWGINAAQIGGDSLSICSYSAITAIHKAKGTKAPIELGMEWFNRLIREAKEVTDLGNTTLCAAASTYSTVYSAKVFTPHLPLDTVLRISETVNQQSHTIDNLQSEISKLRDRNNETIEKLTKNLDEAMESRNKLQKEIDGYVFKIHREKLGVWGLIGLILAILGIVIAFILK